MGKFSDICKIMEDLDRKYHMDNHEEKKEQQEDALIKHVEEEYQKEHEQNKQSK